MGNFRRTVWATVIFVALLAPFAIVLVMALRNPAPPRALLAAQQGGGDEAAASQDTPLFSPLAITPPPATAPADTEEAPLLAAGDGKTLWVVHPVLQVDKDQKIPSYELLARSSNSGTWTRASADSGFYFGGFPHGLATISGAAGSGESPAFVFTDDCITRFTLSEHSLLSRPLPVDQKLLNEAGGVGEMFAITSGPRATAATQPASTDEVPLPVVEDPAASLPASAPASAPAASTRAAPPAVVNVWWYQNDDWTVLPPMVGAPGLHNDSPGPNSSVALSANAGRLIVLWVDPSQPTVLKARSLEYRGTHSQWSPAVSSNLGAALPASAQVMAVTLDDTLYAFWPVSTSKELTLRGGWVVTAKDAGKSDLTLPSGNLLPPLDLGTGPAGTAWSDIAIGPAENSLAVILQDNKGLLSSQLFTNRGRPIGTLAALSIKSTPHDAAIVQNIAMLLLMVMLALSIWQWRQRPMTGELPATLQIAPLQLRVFAFLIDIAIPFLIVSCIFGFGDYDGMLTAWMDSFSNPEELLNAPTLLYTLGLYLAHVTVGELFFRRSIGKALLGLEVLMMDGKAPTVAAVFLRNLVRIPELLPGILILYIFISDKHQRLGDVLARTLVVAQKAPETPADPDAKDDKDDKSEKQGKELVGSGKRERLR